MAKIGVLIESVYGKYEYEKAAQAFKKAKYKLVHIGIKKGLVTGELKGACIKVQKSIKDVSVNDFDALFIPGLYSSNRSGSDAQIINFVKEFSQTEKPIFFINPGAELSVTMDACSSSERSCWEPIFKTLGIKHNRTTA